MVKPLLVLGLNRNGTTWIQNILCNHPEIVGAQHKAHWGAHESGICRNILYWGDLSNNDQFIRFLELYSSADNFKLVKGDKDYFYENRPKNFTEFYLELMDNYARKENVKYWVTKLDPLFYKFPEMLEDFLERAKDRYDEIKFISIKREYKKVLESSMNMQGVSKNLKSFVTRKSFISKNAINYVQGYKTIT